MTAAQAQLKDGRIVKLGRIRRKAPAQCLRFSSYFNASLDASPPPTSVDYASKCMASLTRVYLNDVEGDCVIAGKYHQIGLWTGNDGPAPALATDQEVQNAYTSICGPGDNGCVITDVLDVMRSKGLACGGVLHKIDGYVSVDWTNKLEVQVAIDVFGSLTIGINLPQQWTCTNCVWDEHATGNVGGHDICCVGYNAQGVQCATWGGVVTITWAAFLSRTWIEECYCSLSPDWYGKDNLAPNGIDAASLKADLAKLGGGVIPDPQPPSPIPPTPPVPVPPPSPVPSSFTIHVPQQPVFILGREWGFVPAFNVQGTLTGSDRAQAAMLPPWLVPLLAGLCTASPQLPAPWNAIVALGCALLPTQSGSKPCGCH